MQVKVTQADEAFAARWAETHQDGAAMARDAANHRAAAVAEATAPKDAEIARLKNLLIRCREREYNPFEADNQTKLHDDIAAALGGESQ